ncbi:MAG: hypothetical protein IK048_02740 [Clostridia bacterium]|nr:hypothetical protein [Clostridia bacterium]
MEEKCNELKVEELDVSVEKPIDKQKVEKLSVDESYAQTETGESKDEEPASNEKKSKKHKRRKIHEITFENDIRYRGPFSYRWLRVFAWISIVSAQIALILMLGAMLDAGVAKLAGLAMFLQVFGRLAVPFFLIANFAIIINAQNGYKRLIAGYAFMVLVIFALFMLIYQHYLLGIMAMITANSEQSPQEVFQLIFMLFSNGGYLSFNIFIDLLLCTLFTFFVNYNPKKVFVGKKVIIFRLFAILPALYEIASLTLKALCATKDGFVLPLYVSPFLTTKPPLTFVVFIALAFFIKNRERVFLKRGKTYEEYNAFLKTNINSLHFSIATSVCMIVAAIIDAILYAVLGRVLIPGYEGATLDDGLAIANQLGFGSSVSLLLVIPFIMLFSYTRTHKPSAIDMIIPNVGMVAFVICYVEGLYQFIIRLPSIIGGLFN